MARMYRETEFRSKTIASGIGGDDIFFLSPLQVANANAFVKSVKITCHPKVNAGESYFVVASTNVLPTVSNDWITTGHTGVGGGTVWLSLKRSIKQSTDATDRNDGRIYIHVFCQSAGQQHDFVCEAWGRFLQVVPA